MIGFRSIFTPLAFAIGMTRIFSAKETEKCDMERIYKPAPNRVKMEDQLSRKQSDSALVGRYSVAGTVDEKPPQPER